ncbi:MAG: hypothetical protein RL081_1546 [Pseudomonadota bacterium]
MPQEAQNQRRRHAKLGRGVHAGTVQAVDHHLRTEAMAGMRLGVKEDFGVQHVVSLRARQVGAGHVIEVLLGLEHGGACVVNIQKLLQVVEHISLAQGVHAGVVQRHLVALAHGKNHVGFQRALDMHVELGLGHAAQQLGQALGRDGTVVHRGPPKSGFSALYSTQVAWPTQAFDQVCENSRLSQFSPVLIGI